MRKKAIWMALVALVVLVGCKKKHNDGPPLGKATLLSPEQNELCSSGRIISTTESELIFSWSSAENAAGYILIIKNQHDRDSLVFESALTEIKVVLKRSMPYSWKIVSLSANKKKEQHSEWRQFYNSGPGVVKYVPFPAEAVYPTDGSKVVPVSGRVSLTWKGIDVDKDILGYDIYMGTGLPLTLIKQEHLTETLSDVKVLSNSVYFWRVITRDAAGNSSQSSLFKFTTQ